MNGNFLEANRAVFPIFCVFLSLRKLRIKTHKRIFPSITARNPDREAMIKQTHEQSLGFSRSLGCDKTFL